MAVVDRRIQAVLFLILCHFLWSTNNIIGRSLSEYLSPLAITTLRWLLASLVYPLVMGLGVVKGLSIYANVKTLILGLVGFAIFNIALYQALALAPSSIVGLAYGFTPISIIIVGVVMKVSKPDTLQILGSVLSSIGVTLLFTARGIDIEAYRDSIGILLGILTGFIWAIYTVMQKKLFPEGDQRLITYASLVLSTSLLGVVSSPFIYREVSAISRPEILLQLLWIAALPGAVAYYMWNKAVSIVGSGTAAPYSNLLPVFTALLGYVILGEKLGFGDIIGGLLIVGGSAISTIPRKPGNRISSNT
ncbi:MAG: hypothetical protein DJ555_04680 [Desulfurococcaceae archaeon]|nr:MAG: hypothetical protein DJ555_04680 [Desulfurococcaceae archaeon]